MMKSSSQTIELKRRCPLIGCCCFLLISFSGLICLGIGIVLYSKFDTIFGDIVRQQMIITDDDNHWWYQQWQQSSSSSMSTTNKETLTINVFAIENSNDLKQSWNDTLLDLDVIKLKKNSNRLKPKIREIGPFVFKIEKLKENIVFDDDDKQTVSYVERIRYHFDQLLSYGNLKQKIMVVNSELSSLNPFVRSLMRRGESVKKISNSMRNLINQILNLYAMNIFVERPVWRIIFGPNYDSNSIDDNTGTNDNDINNNNDDEDLETENKSEHEMIESIDNNEADDATSNITNDKLLSIKQESSNVENNNTSYNIDKYTNDETVKNILTIYDKYGQYIKRLGVDINPYELLSGNCRYKNDGSKLISLNKMDLFDKKQDENLYANSVFSFFQNDSIQKYHVNTGINMEAYNEIIAWNDHSYVDAWYGNNQCNRINGTNGKQFTPLVRDDRVYQFIPRLCRSIPLTLSKLDLIHSLSGIKLNRFSESRTFMQSPFRNRANSCYCRYQNQLKRCNFDGILDLANCYKGAPIILTRPHFSGTITKSIKNSINGFMLINDDESFQTYLDIEPISGVALNKMERYQFNVHFPPLPLRLGANRTIPELIIPLFWYQEQSMIQQNEFCNHLKYYFIYPLKYQEQAIISLISFSLLLFFISIIVLYFCFIKRYPIKKIVDQTNVGHINDNNKAIQSKDLMIKKLSLVSNYSGQQPKIYGLIGNDNHSSEPIFQPIQISNLKFNDNRPQLENAEQQIIHVYDMDDDDVNSNNNNNKQSTADRLSKNLMITPVDDNHDQSLRQSPMYEEPINNDIDDGRQQQSAMIPFKRQLTSNNLNQMNKAFSNNFHDHYASLPSTPEHYNRGMKTRTAKTTTSTTSKPTISSPLSLDHVYSKQSMIISNPISSKKSLQKSINSLIRSGQNSETDSGFFQQTNHSTSSDIFKNQNDDDVNDNIDNNLDKNTRMNQVINMHNIREQKESGKQQELNNLSELADHMKSDHQSYMHDHDDRYDDNNEIIYDYPENVDKNDFNDNNNNNNRSTYAAGVYQLLNFKRTQMPTTSINVSKEMAKNLSK